MHAIEYCICPFPWRIKNVTGRVKLFGRILMLTVLISSIQSCSDTLPVEKDFKAYYTCYGKGDDITGPYADIVIHFPDEKLFVFSRETSYMPFLAQRNDKWPVARIIERKGDGDETRPDKDNIYSYARIIKNAPEEVIVHLRYFPDFSKTEFAHVVHEYYAVKPDGKVTRTVQPGRSKLDEFNDHGNLFREELMLTRRGIRQISITEPVFSEDALPAITGNPVILRMPGPEPLLQWTFDEGLASRQVQQRDVAIEKVNRIPCPIEGNTSLWKKGVSGTALAFDGYHSKVTFKNARPPAELAPFTLEAWVALGAYPWKEGAVIDITGKEGGVYLGISDLGRLIFRIAGMDRQHKLVSNAEIGLYRWTHIAATYQESGNEARIYINGQEAGRLSLGGDTPNLVPTDIVIGLNKEPGKTSQHVSRDYPPEIRTPEGNQAMVYGLEGLIDEVTIYGVALSDEQAREAYKLFAGYEQLLLNPDLEPRILPGEVDGGNAEAFGAYYTKLRYHDLWDNLWRTSPWPDIVVRFDQLPCRVVYWRGSNYGAGWVTEKNKWMSDQSSEIMTYYGCAEHMADKQNRFSHVRILENTPARVVVHWRYASVNIMYQFQNRRTWTDEYHYIYPDGMAVRHVNYHDHRTGWQDVQFFSQPGTVQEDNIDLQALTVANLAGDIFKLDWSEGIPENKLEDASISVVNLNSEYKVVVIYSDGTRIGTWGEMERATPETRFAGPWNHWPVSQMPNDGRYALRTDRVTHSALGGGEPDSIAIYGFTNQDIKTLLPLARFWNSPPDLEVMSGTNQVVFDKSQKAYIMEASGGSISAIIKADQDSPLYNPCFVIKNWDRKDIRLTLNNKVMEPGADFRYGFVAGSEGYDLVIWIRVDSEQEEKILIEVQ
jgi:hypothetical protein